MLYTCSPAPSCMLGPFERGSGEHVPVERGEAGAKGVTPPGVGVAVGDAMMLTTLTLPPQ